ncbi:MAG: helix-turn-helix transcriptional regulator [Oscillospiraceae bacterium]|nr:helix-turn-helix transcriptional regulator [Oscillospiraceae bacterium]
MSENKHTEKTQLARCESMSRLQSVISGKWKILIIWYISAYKIQRFNELQRRLDGITQATLTKQLRELEEDGFISRKIYPQVPPKVEYSLTEMGESFVPILLEMQKWSEKNLM